MKNLPLDSRRSRLPVVCFRLPFISHSFFFACSGRGKLAPSQLHGTLVIASYDVDCPPGRSLAWPPPFDPSPASSHVPFLPGHNYLYSFESQFWKGRKKGHHGDYNKWRNRISFFLFCFCALFFWSPFVFRDLLRLQISSHLGVIATTKNTEIWGPPRAARTVVPPTTHISMHTALSKKSWDRSLLSRI